MFQLDPLSFRRDTLASGKLRHPRFHLLSSSLYLVSLSLTRTRVTCEMRARCARRRECWRQLTHTHTHGRVMLHYNVVVLRRLDVWLSGLVVSALGMRTRRPRFDSRVAPLFHWVATLGKLFTHIASPVSQLQETGYKREFSAPKWL